MICADGNAERARHDGKTGPRLGPIVNVRLVSMSPERLCTLLCRRLRLRGRRRARQTCLRPKAGFSALRTRRIRSTALRLGEAGNRVALDRSGRPLLPARGRRRGHDFQHIAIVVADMDAAIARLSAAGGATPISTAGPETLPASSGGVLAYKFRDRRDILWSFCNLREGKVPDYWAKAPAVPASASIIPRSPSDKRLRASPSTSGSDSSRAAAPSTKVMQQERLDAVPGAVVEVTGAPRGRRAASRRVVALPGPDRSDADWHKRCRRDTDFLRGVRCEVFGPARRNGSRNSSCRLGSSISTAAAAPRSCAIRTAIVCCSERPLQRPEVACRPMENRLDRDDGDAEPGRTRRRMACSSTLALGWTTSQRGVPARPRNRPPIWPSGCRAVASRCAPLLPTLRLFAC